MLNWISAGSTVKALPLSVRGSRVSKLFTMLDQGHAKGITP
ncbi:MAG TPA: hypothetical protein P5125_03865 [Kiritimatiellia bacterium]|nr:hypothetical protein [Kiritimatiellia bacterium]HOR97444.1 hypothetical protein [Kiritimatiellia bacterium]HPK36803.1 hypothetical protein [Kiritimatiellia bacterium]HPW75518.1 hypothetical protein [Kiritimatiellia bacterium]HRU19473.1 hypothetical protein [Kiritimatiellia bacterium]